MWFRKIFIGGAIGFGVSGGVVAGMDGENCRPDRYEGWFFEVGGSTPWWGAGIDIGYQDMWKDNPKNPLPPLPGDWSGINEGGTGPSKGFMGKATWCRYMNFKDETEPCGCKK